MRQLSMKPVNIKRRLKKLPKGSTRWRIERRRLLLAGPYADVIKARDRRMASRARKGNGYAIDYCAAHGI